MPTLRQQLDEFVEQFTILKYAVQDRPERISKLYAQDDSVTNSVNKLVAVTLPGGLVEILKTHPRKYAIVSSRNTNTLLAEFLERWCRPIADAYWNSFDFEKLKKFIEDQNNFHTRFKIAKDRGVPSAELHDKEETLFDPLRHDGAKSIKDMIDRAINDGRRDSDEALQIGGEAIEYLVEVIGGSIEGIFRRWRMFPPVFITEEIASHHTGRGKGSLIYLLEDAKQSYVLGAPASAYATCRSILEMILYRHSGLDMTFQNRNNETRHYQLRQMIKMMKKGYNWFDEKSASDLARHANHVIHDYSNVYRLSDPDETKLRDFIMFLRNLISNLPPADAG